MELLDKAIPKKDLAAGIGASILVHGLIFGSAIFWVLLIPHKPLPVPYCSVDLVSMKDLGAGMAEPKGETGATGKAVERRVQRRTRSFRKAGPVVPIRRLAVNDNTGTVDTHVKIKQIEPRETPATPERTQGLESIDRNLDKLVARPKNVPHFAPPVARRAEPQPRSGHRASSVAANEPGGRSSKEAATEGEEEPAGGTPTGNARGGRQGSGRGSAFGSPNGSAAVTQILGMYGQVVREKIQREWSLANDKGVGGLRTVVQVQIRGSGEIVRVVVMKGSGNALFDEAAVRAVNRAGPLPPVPEAAQGSVPQFILTFMPGRVS